MIAPVAGFRDNAVGKAPDEMDHVRTPVPPAEVQVNGVIATVLSMPAEGVHALIDSAAATVLLRAPVVLVCATASALSVTVTV